MNISVSALLFLLIRVLYLCNINVITNTTFNKTFLMSINQWWYKKLCKKTKAKFWVLVTLVLWIKPGGGGVYYKARLLANPGNFGSGHRSPKECHTEHCFFSEGKCCFEVNCYSWSYPGQPPLVTQTSLLTSTTKPQTLQPFKCPSPQGHSWCWQFSVDWHVFCEGVWGV